MRYSIQDYLKDEGGFPFIRIPNWLIWLLLLITSVLLTSVPKSIQLRPAVLVSVIIGFVLSYVGTKLNKGK